MPGPDSPLDNCDQKTMLALYVLPLWPGGSTCPDEKVKRFCSAVRLRSHKVLKRFIGHCVRDYCREHVSPYSSDIKQDSFATIMREGVEGTGIIDKYGVAWMLLGHNRNENIQAYIVGLCTLCSDFLNKFRQSVLRREAYSPRTRLIVGSIYQNTNPSAFRLTFNLVAGLEVRAQLAGPVSQQRNHYQPEKGAATLPHLYLENPYQVYDC